MGDLAKNFSRAEFLCRHCQLVVGPDMLLVDVLQRMRTAQGQPMRIVSGYRCAPHNIAVGGSRRSQHVTGRAADIPAAYPGTIQDWKDAGATGIGVRDRQVVHVDVRRDVGVIVFPD